MHLFNKGSSINLYIIAKIEKANDKVTMMIIYLNTDHTIFIYLLSTLSLTYSCI
jgi:hypothetical protein